MSSIDVELLNNEDVVLKPATKASVVSIEDADNNFTSNNVEEVVKELYSQITNSTFYLKGSISTTAPISPEVNDIWFDNTPGAEVIKVRNAQGGWTTFGAVYL